MRSKKRKREESIIRSYVANHVLPRHVGVDEEDVATLLSILVATGLVSVERLYGKDCDTNLPRPNSFRYDGVAGRTARRRINSIELWSHYTSWEFHTSQVFELLERLESLEKLTLNNCAFFQLAETLSRLPNLKQLYVSCYSIDGSNDVDGISIGPLDSLREKEVRTQLETLILSSHSISSEDDLAIFLFDVLPLLPKLLVFEVCDNKVTSFQKIARRINDDNIRAKIISCRLRTLNLGFLKYDTNDERLRMSELLCKDPIEVEAMKTVLLAFRELRIIRLTHHEVTFEPCPCQINTDLDYLMEINYAGRVLLEA